MNARIVLSVFSGDNTLYISLYIGISKFVVIKDGGDIKAGNHNNKGIIAKRANCKG
ncbi:MAG: hypothetical protein WC679_09040 [Bacteroidales bacterium]|jgi:hypothetical protein